MHIGGSGLIGCKRGTLFALAGHDVVVSDSRSPDELEALAHHPCAQARADTSK